MLVCKSKQIHATLYNGVMNIYSSLHYVPSSDLGTSGLSKSTVEIQNSKQTTITFGACMLQGFHKLQGWPHTEMTSRLFQSNTSHSLLFWMYSPSRVPTVSQVLIFYTSYLTDATCSPVFAYDTHWTIILLQWVYFSGSFIQTQLLYYEAS